MSFRQRLATFSFPPLSLQRAPCEEEYEEASRQREKKLESSRMNEALEWLREHKTEVALGTIVIVAGVAFVVTIGGSGLLLLAPLSL